MLAEELHAGAQHTFATLTELATAAVEAWMQDHLLAGFQEGLVRIHLLDQPGPIQAHDLGQGVRDALAAVAHVQIDLVEGGSLQADQHLAWPAGRSIAFADLDDLVTTVTGDECGFQLCVPS